MRRSWEEKWNIGVEISRKKEGILHARLNECIPHKSIFFKQSSSIQERYFLSLFYSLTHSENKEEKRVGKPETHQSLVGGTEFVYKLNYLQNAKH